MAHPSDILLGIPITVDAGRSARAGGGAAADEFGDAAGAGPVAQVRPEHERHRLATDDELEGLLVVAGAAVRELLTEPVYPALDRKGRSYSLVGHQRCGGEVGERSGSAAGCGPDAG